MGTVTKLNVDPALSKRIVPTLACGACSFSLFFLKLIHLAADNGQVITLLRIAGFPLSFFVILDSN